jgi:arginine-tRNA-protein transferase
MTDLSNIKLFATHPHECSYLDDRKATTIFVDPEQCVDQTLYSRLSELGFRRSGTHVYRPKCQQCTACIPTRVVSSQFEQTRSQKRCFKKNSDLTVKVSKTFKFTAYYDLYERYINERHCDGDMYPPSEEQFRSFLNNEWDITEYVEFWLTDTLIGVAVIDRLDNGLAAVYTFYDPDYERRSLGTFAILWQIEYVISEGLECLYLGYWIKQSRKMNYKIHFRPLQMLADKQWITIS